MQTNTAFAAEMSTVTEIERSFRKVMKENLDQKRTESLMHDGRGARKDLKKAKTESLPDCSEKELQMQQKRFCAQ